MAQGIDFLSLYREFQLDPGASIDDLKRAYRRRVARVHPDRLDSKDAISQHLATAHLQRLTTLYEAGVQFHRQHGRLPGASAAAGTPADSGRVEAPTWPPPRGARKTHRLRRAASALMLAGVLAWWLWPHDAAQVPTANPSVPVHYVTDSGAGPSARLAESDGIHVGMRKEAVLRTHGAPVMREGERWLYGPSWILFREGKVAEWYSSPLHPLRISRRADK